MPRKAPPASPPSDRDRLRRYLPLLALFRDAIIAEMAVIFLAGFRAHAPAVPVSPDVSGLANDWAGQRADALIDQLTATTRTGVADAITDAGRNATAAELATALSAASVFGANRAATIAETATVHAYRQGERAAAVVLGENEKSWVPGACEICRGNADDGWIAIDDTFGSGHDAPPAHPRCGCSCAYRVRSAAEKAIVAEARCPKCGRWVGRNVNVGAEVFCPEHKGVVIRGS